MDTHRTALDIVNLSVAYGSHRVVDGLTFRLDSGQTLALLGPNGSGKTTILRACAGILGPEALISGSVKGSCVYVGDDLTSEFALRVSDILELADLHRSIRGITVRSAVDEFCLDPIMEKTLRSLSHGQRQRVNLARAWIQGPLTLLLDESLSALDSASRIYTLKRIQARAERGLSTVLVSHDPTLLEIATQKYMVAPNA